MAAVACHSARGLAGGIDAGDRGGHGLEYGRMIYLPRVAYGLRDVIDAHVNEIEPGDRENVVESAETNAVLHEDPSELPPVRVGELMC
jgi:hypothetical protein